MTHDDEHRELDSLLKMPLWCSLVVRVVKPKSAESQCDGAADATKKELKNTDSKMVCNVNDVFCLRDLLNNNDISEAMLGRAFAILVVKGEELGDAMQQ